MTARRLMVWLLLTAAPLGAWAEVINGQVGDVRLYRMQRGMLYEYEVRSYQFTPGINFVLPSGRTAQTAREAVQRPWHDGRGMVRATVTKFHAPETGTYRLQVFSWDDRRLGLAYSMSDSLIGAEEPEPRPQPQPAPRSDCRPGSCFDPTVGGCVPDNVPNYCGF